MTKIDAAFLGLQLEYSRWASERAVEAARPLDEGELSRDLGNSYGGVLGTLVHVYHADRVWLSRLMNSPRSTLADPGEVWTLDKLADEWARTADGWRDWVAGVNDFQRVLDYKNQAGQPHSLPLWQVVLHVVNHATYHRGQITTMLRQLGYTPVATDMHVFYFGHQI